MAMKTLFRGLFVAGAAVVAAALSTQDAAAYRPYVAYYQPAVAYYAPAPVYVAPAPVVAYYAPAPAVVYQPATRVRTRYRPILGGTVSHVRSGYVPVVYP
ncbi:MAG: hypothetical protein KDA44_09560 [Planctomycetales bacterium]|nr:hypothetical protein [Planctomycetales bacterium]